MGKNSFSLYDRFLEVKVDNSVLRPLGSKEILLKSIALKP